MPATRPSCYLHSPCNPDDSPQKKIHFREEESEVQRGETTSLRMLNVRVNNPGESTSKGVSHPQCNAEPSSSHRFCGSLKKHLTGQWNLLLNLLSPYQGLVNHGVGHRNTHIRPRRKQERPHAMSMILGGALIDKDKSCKSSAGDSHR